MNKLLLSKIENGTLLTLTNRYFGGTAVGFGRYNSATSYGVIKIETNDTRFSQTYNLNSTPLEGTTFTIPVKIGTIVTFTFSGTASGSNQAGKPLIKSVGGIDTPDSDRGAAYCGGYSITGFTILSDINNNVTTTSGSLSCAYTTTFDRVITIQITELEPKTYIYCGVYEFYF